MVTVLLRLDKLNMEWLPMQEGEIVFRCDLGVRAVADMLAVTLRLQNGELLSPTTLKRLAESMIPEIADTFWRQWFKELYSQFPSETRKVLVLRAPSKLGRKSSMAELMRHLLVTAEFNAPIVRPLYPSYQL